MNSYNFQSTCTNALIINVRADSEEAAWIVFDVKSQILESMGVFIPRRATWSIVTSY